MQVKHYQSLIRRNATAIAELEADARLYRDYARFEKLAGEEGDQAYIASLYGKVSTAKRNIAKLAELQVALKDEMRWALFMEKVDREYAHMADEIGVGVNYE